MIWYHITKRENFSLIKSKGLIPNSGYKNYSLGSLEYMEEIYGTIPIFLSKKPWRSLMVEEVLLEVDMTGIEANLVADIPVLLEQPGVFMAEDHVWFDEEADPILLDLAEEISFEDLTNPNPIADAVINYTGTAAYKKKINPDRIKLSAKKNNINLAENVFFNSDRMRKLAKL